MESGKLAEQQPAHEELHIARSGARTELFRDDAAQIGD